MENIQTKKILVRICNPSDSHAESNDDWIMDKAKRTKEIAIIQKVAKK